MWKELRAWSKVECEECADADGVTSGIRGVIDCGGIGKHGAMRKARGGQRAWSEAECDARAIELTSADFKHFYSHTPHVATTSELIFYGDKSSIQFGGLDKIRLESDGVDLSAMVRWGRVK
jgi:hypothetical protein